MVTVGVLALSSCRVDVPDNALYPCATDHDCGGGGFICVTPTGETGRCCKPTGDEICDGIDNECNAAIDDIPATPCYDQDAGTAGRGRGAGGRPPRENAG